MLLIEEGGRGGGKEGYSDSSAMQASGNQVLTIQYILYLATYRARYNISQTDLYILRLMQLSFFL